MESKKITEYNPQELKHNKIEFSDWKEKPVLVKISFKNYDCLFSKIYTLLDAIESIGHNGDNDNLVTCGGLAELCKMLIPEAEINFLDSLLIKKDSTKNQFIKI